MATPLAVGSFDKVQPQFWYFYHGITVLKREY